MSPTEYSTIKTPYRSLCQLIETACQRFADNQAFVCLDHSVTFGEIEQYSRAFAAYLQQIDGLNPGDRIAIQLPNLIQYAIAAYGAIRAGMVLVNTNPNYTERELIHQYNDSGAKVVIALDQALPLLEKVIPQTVVTTVITTHPLDLIKPQPASTSQLNAHSFVEVLNQGANLPYTPVDCEPEQLIALQYTGGTTGLSKGAMLTHANILANTEQVKSRLGDKLKTGKELFIVPLPIYHIYAFVLSLVVYLEIGCSSVLIPNPRDISSLVAAFANYPATTFAGLNTLFIGLCHQEAFKQVDFSQLKLTFSGGSALTEAAASLWQKVTGCTITEGYGLSETSPVVTFNQPGEEQLGTIGTPVCNTSVLLLDGNDEAVTIGQAGELAVRGPQVMRGYWQKPEETAKVMTANGYFKTSDIAIETEDGFFKIVDRKKDMILVSGFNVYPNEIENVIAMHPAVLECAVIGVSDAHSGEKVKACIVLKDKQVADTIKEALTQHCREQLTAYKVPKEIEILEQLPKSSVGKVLRRKLRPTG